MTAHRHKTSPRSFEVYMAPYYRKSPFWQSTVDAGCISWDVCNHSLIPNGYPTDEVTEYWHLINKVTVWDVNCERQVEITGPDAAKFTQLLTSRDLSGCAIGQCKYAPIIAPDGGIVNDPILLRLGENHFWLSLSNSDVLLYAKGVQAFAGLDVQLREPDVSPMQIQGPRSTAVMTALFGAGHEVMNLKYYHCLETTVGDIPVVVSRTGWTGEVGYEIFLRDGTRGDDLWDAVFTAGEPSEIAVGVPSDARRMEAGIFTYGMDMTMVHNLLQVTGMERLAECLDNDIEHIGKEPLQRVRDEGVAEKLVGIDMAGDAMEWITDFWPVEVAGKRIGRVTSYAYSPRLEKNMAYAWLPTGLIDEGTEVTVISPDGPLDARVTPLPFFDAKKLVPLGASV